MTLLVQVKSGVWSPNNIGFFSCLLIECVTIFLFIGFYVLFILIDIKAYDRYVENLL